MFYPLTSIGRDTYPNRPEKCGKATLALWKKILFPNFCRKLADENMSFAKKQSAPVNYDFANAARQKGNGFLTNVFAEIDRQI